MNTACGVQTLDKEGKKKAGKRPVVVLFVWPVAQPSSILSAFLDERESKRQATAVVSARENRERERYEREREEIRSHQVPPRNYLR